MRGSTRRARTPQLRHRGASRALGIRLVAGLAVGLLLGGCTGADDRPPAPSPAPRPDRPAPTTLAAIETAEVTVARTDLCPLVPPEAVERALDGAARTETTYADGERAELAPGVRDVAHEFSCAWTGRDRAVARTWVFAPPVTGRAARGLVRDLADRPGCEAPGGAAFGRPSVLTVCREPAPQDPDGTGAVRRAVTTATYAGLFVDAWLSCSLTGPSAGDLTRAELLRRTDRWCADLVTVLDTGAPIVPARGR